jgi:hypothetical protein
MLFGGMASTTAKFAAAWNVLWKTWDEFWQRTNISGMCNARSSNSGFRRNVWMLIFAVFTILTFTGLSDVIKDFQRYPVTTSVHVEHRNQVCEFKLNIYLLSYDSKNKPFTNIINIKYFDCRSTFPQ